ncbi:hypothetical protein PGT21_010010 [Puccinia graminis f. sp. tritici]|uniref:Uncharacterized protein n=1 Tax=Puccinia graminis f. sp. tritici TaxID=56615 RepID=A0A5B0P7P0_PUCGR|nr:hypothetical protein PGT21_010010 [Puccinia graminis f. sp. tritici]
MTDQAPPAGFLTSPHPILPSATTSLQAICIRDPAGPNAPNPTRRPTRPDPRAPETHSKQENPRTPDFKLIQTDPDRSDPIRSGTQKLRLFRYFSAERSETSLLAAVISALKFNEIFTKNN